MVGITNMQTALIVSNLLLWISLIVLLLAVFALARQIGVLHERVAPVGALMPTAGPKIGELVEPLDVPELSGEHLLVGGVKKYRTLIYFLSPTCPICKSLLPTVLSMVVDEGESLQLILASDGDDLDVHRAYAEENNLRQYPYVISQPLGMRMGVNKLPFAVLINKEGILRARGLVNSREHLESLVQANELDVSSLQEYLGDQSG